MAHHLTLGMSEIYPWTLVGLADDDPSVRAFLAGLFVAPQRDQYGGLRIEHYPDKGFSIYFTEEAKVRSIFLYCGDSNGIQRYTGPLPGEVNFEFGRGDLIARFGRPDRSGSNWDRFPYGGRYLHFEYTNDGEKISIIRAFPWD